MPDAGTETRKGALGVIFLILFLDLVGFGIILPVLPFIGLRFSASAIGVGALLAIYSVMQFVFAPVWGRLSDRIGRRPVILASSAAMSLSFIAFAFAPNYAVLFAARAFAGIAAANIGVAQAYVADITSPEDRAKGMGMVGAAIGLGFVVGPAIGGTLSAYGFAVPALLAAALSALNVAVGYVLLKESRRPGAASGQLVRAGIFDGRRFLETASRPVVGPLIILNFVFILGFSAMESTLALFLDATRGWAEQESGFLFFYVGVVIVIAQGALIGPLVRRFGERALLVTGLVGTGLALIALPFSSTLTLLLATVGVLALANGLASPTLSSLVSRAAADHEQGNVLGVYQGASSLARAIGPIIGSVAFAFVAPGAGFLVGAALTGIALMAASVAFVQARAGSTALDGEPVTPI